MTGPKTVSEKQLVANRANAQHSTGPRTPAGTARSRWNALTHGALAQAIIPPSLAPFESRQAFGELLVALRDELAPASAIEEILVERIAVSYWRLARLVRAEAATIANRQEDIAYDQAKQERRDALDSVRSGMPSLAKKVEIFSEAIKDKRQLRRLITQNDPNLDQVSDERLLADAQTILADSKAKLAAQQKRLESAQRDQRSIPPLADAIQFARYETTLERQLYRALDALERLQRLRHGEDVPPPLHLSVDASITGSDAQDVEE